MSIIDRLFDDKAWREFYALIESRGKTRPNELKEFSDFIEKKRYLQMAERIANGEPFPLPEKRLVNKIGNTKKRVVYTYPQDENYVLKLITRLLYEYDGAFSPNLYSFRRKFGVKRAFSVLTADKRISGMYSYKADIHNYFNSVDIDLCVSELKEVITDDGALLSFIERLLREDRVTVNGAAVSDAHGIMAGVPTASFLANVYLRKMDEYFERRGVIYARYSDDIIVFADSLEELNDHVTRIKAFLAEYKLEINPKKEIYVQKGDPWSFLGIQYNNGKTDISPISLDKVKAKLRRKANALLRWKRKKGLENICAVRAFIKYMNRYFYSNTNPDEMTWARWYFPIITTDKSLKAIDSYALELIRYVFSERHSKSNYNFRYEEIKKLGYRPLVAEFYKAIEEQRG